MICKYYKKNYSIQQLRKITYTSQNGVSILGMVEAAEQIGITAEGYSGGIDDLKKFMKETQTPVILHTKENHFVVGYKKSQKYIYIKDPAKGKYKLSWNELESIWSGYIIGFLSSNNTEAIVLPEERKGKCIVIGELMREYIPSLLKVFILSVIIFCITICSNYVFQVLIDHGGTLESGHKCETENVFIQFLEIISRNNIYLLLVYMILFFIIMALMVGIRGKCIALMSRKIDISLVKKYTKKISKASIHDISTRMMGEYIARISDLVSLRMIISDILIVVSLDITMIVASIIILIQTNKFLFMISLVSVFLYVLVALLLKNRIKNVNHRIMNDNAEMQSFFKEFVQGIETIKANNENKRMEDKFFQKYIKYADSIYYGNIIGVISNSLSTLIEQIGNILIVIIGFVFVETKLITQLSQQHNCWKRLISQAILLF